MVSTNADGILGNLSVQQGPMAGQQFPVTKPTVTIGRTAGNDIIINDPEVSRHHARLTWDGQQFIIEDLGSTNGTFINGVRITGPQPLASGAALRLGDLDVSFQSSLAAAGSDAVTNVNMPAPQQPVPAAVSPVAAPPVAPVRGSIPWLPIVVGGALLVLALIAVVLAATVFLKPGGSDSLTTITAPLDGSEVTVAGDVPVIAVVNDDGGISRVELWVNGGLQDTAISSDPQGQTVFPVQFQWMPDHEGSHMLEVRPYSRSGQTGEPASVVVNAVPGEDTTALVVATATGEFGVVEDVPDSGAASGAGGCTPDAAFVSDVTIPDYTEIPAGQNFEKIWRISNSGTCAWDAGYRLVYASGDSMSAPASQGVSPTAPGGTADVPVSMYAPASPGTYKGTWRMQDADGQGFGTNLTVVVIVPADDAGPADVPPDDGPPDDVPPPDDTSGSSGCTAAVDFRADETVIDRGDTTTLRWDVECVREVYFEDAPVTGHEHRDVSPETTTTYTLRVVKEDGSDAERQVTVEVREEEEDADSGSADGGADSSSSTPDVEIAFHSNNPSNGQVIFRIHNGSASPTLESVDAEIVNFSSGETYVDGYANAPFASTLDPVPFDSRLESGGTAYLKYVLPGAPTNVRCRATFDVYTGESRTGERVRKVVDFSPPGDSASAPNVAIAFVSYDSGTGQAIFRIRNAPDSPTLECVNTQIVNYSSGASYYGGYSNAPFAGSMDPVPFSSRLEPEGLAYLKYVLSGRPSDVRCRATFDVYTEESRSGEHVTKVVDFTATGSSSGGSSGGGTLGANISYHSYDASTGWVTFRIVNDGGVTIESAETKIMHPGTGTVLYGPGFSHSPFRNSPTSGPLVDSLAPGETKYMRYRLTGATSGTPAAASVKLYDSNDRSGASTTRTLGFVLP